MTPEQLKKLEEDAKQAAIDVAKAKAEQEKKAQEELQKVINELAQ